MMKTLTQKLHLEEDVRLCAHFDYFTRDFWPFENCLQPQLWHIRRKSEKMNKKLNI